MDPDAASDFSAWLGWGRSSLLAGRGLRRAALRVVGRRTALSAWTVAAAMPAGSASAGRHEFVGRELAVAIFVQCLQGGRGVGNFIGINHAVVVGVEGGDDRRDRWMVGPTRAGPGGRPIGTRPAHSLGRGRAVGAGRTR